ncbi:MAG: molybdopterin-binding protein [Anaerococcus sp.]|nr:molybdopterin-binding protein [Anaerococcus sp.]
MIKKIRVEEALGKPLLHDLTGIRKDGFKGVVFKRGHIIKEEDLEVLKDIGKENVYVGELDPGFVHEEDAIKLVAGDLAGLNVGLSGVSEGKISFISKKEGLFTINRDQLKALNSGNVYTFATIPSYRRVREGDLLVGARIIPLFTKDEEVEKIKAISDKYGPCFNVHPFKKLKVSVIITGSEVYYGRIKDMFEPVIRKKLRDFDHDIIGIKKCPDDMTLIEEAARDYLDKGSDLLVFSGGMSVDPDDLTPSVIRKLSDQFISQGLPVQPGNMLTIGKARGAYLVGVPGASMHADFTSFDIFLPRIFAGLDIKKEDFVELGEGGLLNH